VSVTLSGHVTAAGVAVSGATVGPYGATGLLVGSAATTDGSGAYSLTLAAGVYRLLVIKAGYPDTWHGASSFAGAMDILLVSATVTVDVALYPAPASGFTLGDVTIWHDGFSGFAVPQFVTRTRVLSDGTSTGNEVVQSGAIPRRTATLSLPWLEDADYLTLRAAAEAVTHLWLVTPLDSLTVYIEDFAPTAIFPGLWSATVTLVAVP
jgi:hypothetical protein